MTASVNPYSVILKTFMRPDKLDRWIRRLIVWNLQDQMNMRIIVVSDHGYGFQEAEHTSPGFYSANQTLDPEPEEITDFHTMVTEVLASNRDGGMLA